MKTSHLFIACLLVMTGLISCNSSESEGNPDQSTSVPPPSMASFKPADSVKPAVDNKIPVTTALNPAHGLPGHRCDLAVGAPLNSAPGNNTPVQVQPTVQMPSSMQANPNSSTISTAKPVVTTALNPAHGLPGHRCDLAVGAPLNSAPANSTPVQVQPPVQMPSPMLANPNSSTISTAKPVIANQTPITTGLNPAHGLPGHRCEIAVGAPLNSAPASSTPVQIQPPAQVAASLKAKLNSSNSTVKLNPAHGQPGHDCSVEVGKPLKAGVKN